MVIFGTEPSAKLEGELCAYNAHTKIHIRRVEAVAAVVQSKAGHDEAQLPRTVA